MLKEVEFRSWLLTVYELQPKSACDVLSRCRRIERDFDISLDDTLRTHEGFSSLILKIKDSYTPELTSSKSKPYSITGTLIRACRLYCEFRFGAELSNSFLYRRKF